jgi:DNA-binding transcriptional MerR regulator
MTTTEPELTISAVAEATGLSVHTLRYYEQAGLMLTPVHRASSTHRRYSETDVAWVVFLGRLRSTGMPIRAIEEYVELVRRGESSVLERLELLVAHRERVLGELAETQASLAAIDYKITRYSQLLGVSAEGAALHEGTR